MVKILLLWPLLAVIGTTALLPYSSGRSRWALRSLRLQSTPRKNDDTNTFLKPPGQPLAATGWPDKFPAQSHCSRCGLCESTYVSHVKQACSFLPYGMMQGMDNGWEARVHGRGRQRADSVKDETIADELRFGVLAEPVYLARGVQSATDDNHPAPQWTGVVSNIAESMLEQDMVDAVICIGAAPTDDPLAWATPEPLLARTVKEVRRGRGVKPSLAPTLRILDDIRAADPPIRSLLVCGVGCAVQAFRAVEAQVRHDNPALRDIFVLGTNCADNSPTPQAAQNFIQKGIMAGASKDVSAAAVKGYEFMTDFQIHVKLEDKGYMKKPYFCLPPALAAPSIAPSCLACFDYTNALADVVVGYMGAPAADRMDASWQTLTIRNDRGRRMVDAAVRRKRLVVGEKATGKGTHQAFAMSTVQSDAIVQEMLGNVVDPDKQGIPLWLGNIMARLLQAIGPKGVAFARYSIDYHLLRNYLHVLAVWGPEEVEARVPEYARQIVDEYRSDNDMFRRIENHVLQRVSEKKQSGTSLLSRWSEPSSVLGRYVAGLLGMVLLLLYQAMISQFSPEEETATKQFEREQHSAPGQNTNHKSPQHATTYQTNGKVRQIRTAMMGIWLSFCSLPTTNAFSQPISSSKVRHRVQPHTRIGLIPLESLSPGLAEYSDKFQIPTQDENDEQLAFYLPEQDDLDELTTFIVESFGADAIVLSSDMNAVERMLAQPFAGVLNGYSGLAAYAEVLSGLNQRLSSRLSRPSLDPPELLSSDSLAEQSKVASRSALVLVVAKVNSSEIVGAVELRLEITDGKIPFSLPSLDRLERSIARLAFRPSRTTSASLQPYLSTLCVAPEYRQRGIGRALVQCLECLTRVCWKPYSRVYLHVDPDNSAAVQLYEKAGYEPVRGIRWNPFWAGPAADILYFVKDL